MIDQFWDEQAGGIFFTGRDHETLIARSKDPQDDATPSGNSLAATALCGSAKLTGNADLQNKAVRTLQGPRGLLASSPMAAGQLLIALDFHLGPVTEVAILAQGESEELVPRLQYFTATSAASGGGGMERGQASDRSRASRPPVGREDRAGNGDDVSLPGFHLPGPGGRRGRTATGVGTGGGEVAALRRLRLSTLPCAQPQAAAEELSRKRPKRR